jgi:hypothetical protein
MNSCIYIFKFEFPHIAIENCEMLFVEFRKFEGMLIFVYIVSSSARSISARMYSLPQSRHFRFVSEISMLRSCLSETVRIK